MRNYKKLKDMNMCKCEEKETVCEGCMLFRDRWCGMHNIEVDRDEEGCRDYIDRKSCGEDRNNGKDKK